MPDCQIGCVISVQNCDEPAFWSAELSASLCSYWLSLSQSLSKETTHFLAWNNCYDCCVSSWLVELCVYHCFKDCPRMTMTTWKTFDIDVSDDKTEAREKICAWICIFNWIFRVCLFASDFFTILYIGILVYITEVDRHHWYLLTLTIYTPIVSLTFIDIDYIHFLHESSVAQLFYIKVLLCNSL